jgi:hypothetical protein
MYYHSHWLAAIDKAAFYNSAFVGSFFGKALTGTNTPLSISSARRAFFFSSISAFFAALSHPHITFADRYPYDEISTSCVVSTLPLRSRSFLVVKYNLLSMFGLWGGYR